jgi:hypothetical protein
LENFLVCLRFSFILIIFLYFVLLNKFLAVKNTIVPQINKWYWQIWECPKVGHVARKEPKCVDREHSKSILSLIKQASYLRKQKAKNLIFFQSKTFSL